VEDPAVLSYVIPRQREVDDVRHQVFVPPERRRAIKNRSTSDAAERRGRSGRRTGGIRETGPIGVRFHERKSLRGFF
jgi:hypothetical protein